MENPSNNNDNKSTRRSISEKIQDYVLEHLLTVMWSFSLLIGGFIFWRYFFHIGYFPDLNFQEVVLLLVGAALWGFIYVFVLDVLLLLPAVCYCIFSWTNAVSDNERINRKNNSTGEDKNFKLIERSVPFFASIFLFEFILLLSLAHEYKDLTILIIVIFIIMIIVMGSRCYKEPCSFFMKIIHWIQHNWSWIKHNWSYVLQWFFVLTLVTIIFLVSLGKIFADLDDHNTDFALWMLLIYIIVNGLIAFLWDHPEKRKPYLFLLLVVIGFISIILFPDPQQVMAKFRFGNFVAERFLVDKQGYKIYKNFACVPESNENKKPEEADVFLIENIKILLRLGREFRLEKECHGEIINFNIPKQHVLSWSVTKPRPKEKKSDTKLK